MSATEMQARATKVFREPNTTTMVGIIGGSGLDDPGVFGVGWSTHAAHHFFTARPPPACPLVPEPPTSLGPAVRRACCLRTDLFTDRKEVDCDTPYGKPSDKMITVSGAPVQPLAP